MRRHLHFWVGLTAQLRKPFYATRVWGEIAAILDNFLPVCCDNLGTFGPVTAGRAQHLTHNALDGSEL